MLFFDPSQFDDWDKSLNSQDVVPSTEGAQISWSDDNDEYGGVNLGKLKNLAPNADATVYLIDATRSCTMRNSSYFHDVLTSIVRGIFYRSLANRNDMVMVQIQGSQGEVDLLPMGPLTLKRLRELRGHLNGQFIDILKAIGDNQSLGYCTCCEDEATRGEDVSYPLQVGLMRAASHFSEIPKARRIKKRLLVISHSNISGKVDKVNMLKQSVNDIGSQNISMAFIPYNPKSNVKCPSYTIDTGIWKQVGFRGNHDQAYVKVAQITQIIYKLMASNVGRISFNTWLQLDEDTFIILRGGSVTAKSAPKGKIYHIDTGTSLPVVKKTVLLNEGTGSTVDPSSVRRVVPISNLQLPYNRSEAAKMNRIKFDDIPKELINTPKAPSGDNRVVVLGFVESKVLSRYEHSISLSSSYAVVPCEHLLKGSAKIFNSFIDSMRASDKIGIALFCRGRFPATYVYMVPSEGDEADCLYLRRMCFDEEIRDVEVVIGASRTVQSEVPLSKDDLSLWENLICDELKDFESVNKNVDLPENPSRKRFISLVEEVGIGVVAASVEPLAEDDIPSVISEKLSKEIFGGCIQNMDSSSPKKKGRDIHLGEMEDLVATGKVGGLLLTDLKNFCMANKISSIGKKADLVNRVVSFIQK